MSQPNLDFTVVEAPEKSSSSRRSGIMLCYPFEEKRLATWKPPYIIQPKLDGVRCRALINEGTVMLISSEGHVIEQVPHVNEGLRCAADHIELDGELYCHGMSFQDIFSRTSRTKNIHTDVSKIQFHAFDIVSSQAQIERIAELNKLGFFIDSDAVQIVPPSLVRDTKEVMELYEKYVGDGYEGFIIRDSFSSYFRKRFTGIMKFKPHQKDDYLIIGTIEEVSIHGDAKGTLGAFVCAGNDGTVFNVGTGLTQEQRINYWKYREELVGKKLKVKYQSLTQGRGVPRFPVALEVIGGM